MQVLLDMRANVLPNEEYYYFGKDVDIVQNHQEVMRIIKKYLEEKSSAERDELGTMLTDIEKYRNFVCRFDDYTEMERFGNQGKRVAYGAFRHTAPVHGVQTSWSYTYEILDIGDQYYMALDSEGWLPDDNLRQKVGQLLE